jgi:hypothetical protein
MVSFGRASVEMVLVARRGVKGEIGAGRSGW